MINRFLKRILCCLLAFVLFNFSVSAASFRQGNSYDYTYNQTVYSAPESYYFNGSIDKNTLGIEDLSGIKDVFVHKALIYILDKGKGLIYVLNADYSLNRVIGEELGLNSPESFYITPEDEIYIADTGNSRIVKCDIFGKLLWQKSWITTKDGQTVKEKVNEISDVEFEPVKIAVDSGHRIYVLAANETNGLVQLDSDGSFMNFFGAVPVVPDMIELFWRKISTKEQLSRMEFFVPTEYSAIDIDKDGFIYAVVSNKSDDEIFDFIKGKGSDASLAVIRRLNPKGSDVLLRNGSMPPAGDLVTTEGKKGEILSSRFIDIDVRADSVYAALDKTRNRVFVYDREGRLLCIFGDNVDNKNQLLEPTAICFKGDEILVVDSKTASIKIFTPTEYASTIFKAISTQSGGNNDEAARLWDDVLKYNPNSEVALTGKGASYVNDGKYKDAMNCFKKADNKEEYSEAFKLYRKEKGYQVTGYILGALAIAIVLYLVLKHCFFKNKGTQNTSRKKNMVLNGFKYGFHIIVHPFDGFWDMKYEARGNVVSATLIFLGVVICNVCRLAFSGYLFSDGIAANSNLFVDGVLKIVVPLLLWCIANWSLSSLFDGIGNFKDIYMYSGYSLLPMLIFIPIQIVVSNFASLDEQALIGLLSMIMYVWVGFLLFCGTAVIHRYSALKTVFTIFGILLAIAIIVFVCLIGVAVVQKILEFVLLIIEEISLRT